MRHLTTAGGGLRRAATLLALLGVAGLCSCDDSTPAGASKSGTAGSATPPRTVATSPRPQTTLPVPARQPSRRAAVPPAPESGAPYVLEPRSADLGAVGDLERRVVEFTIENTTGEPIRLGTPKPSCDCMKVTLASGAIQPGEKRLGRIDVGLGRGVGRFDKHVDFFLPDGSHKQQLRVLAQRHPGLTLEPRFGSVKPITFLGATLPESRHVVTLTRRSTDGAPLRVENLRAEDQRGAVFETRLERRHDYECAIVIQAKSGGAEGMISARIRAVVNGLPLEIPVNGFQYEHLVRRPQHFSFLRIDDPATARAVVEIHSPVGVPFEVTEAVFVEGRRKSAASVDVQIEPRDGGGFVLTARTRAPYPTKTGSLSGVVRVRTTHPDRPELEIRVIGLYKGKN